MVRSEIEDTRDLEAELLGALGEERLVALAEKVGGFRFYVPMSPELSRDKYDIGHDTLEVLARLYGGDYIVIPLFKRLRAKRMYSEGQSYAQIARALVMSESGVYRLLSRRPNPKNRRIGGR